MCKNERQAHIIITILLPINAEWVLFYLYLIYSF